MEKTYCDKIAELYSACEALAENKRRAVIAIDGRAASGKSTLAESIAERIGGCVVHADDFFLPFSMRTPERLAQPGGNIHHERLACEVISHIGTSFDYGVFDCSAGEVTHRKHINGDCPLIIEGAYSASPSFGNYYDLLVFVTASLDVRMQRIVARSGAEQAERFRDRWIPLEESYLSAFGIEERADIIIDTTDV